MEPPRGMGTVANYLDPQSYVSSADLEYPLIKQESSIPIICSRLDEDSLLAPTQLMVKRELIASANCLKSEKLSPTTSPGLTTDLENFQDLTEWCHRTPKIPIMSLTSVTDELNTPIVELDEFLFTIPTTIDNRNDCYSLLNVTPQNESPDVNTTGIDIQSNKFNVMDSQPVYGNDNIIFDNDKDYKYSNNIFINDNGGGEDVLKTTKKFTLMDSYNLNNSVSTSEYSEHFCNTISELNEHPSVPFIENTMHHPTSTSFSSHKNTEEVFTNIPDETNTAFSAQFPLPIEEISMQPVNINNHQQQNTGSANNKSQLRLDFTNLWMEKTTSPIISTPDVINAALELDRGFNLVNFINHADNIEELQPSDLVAQDDVEQSLSSSTSNDNNDPSYSISETSDDDDYEPPWKKRNVKTQKPAAKKPSLKTVDFSFILSAPSKRESCDSELSNISQLEAGKTIRKRGRPPKRPVSVSSESNADTEVSKYRELRDKNNEASRRSRLNRKVKETELEAEADVLDARNLKLKVRVEELEKLVNTMRSNLMQMLLKK